MGRSGLPDTNLEVKVETRGGERRGENGDQETVCEFVFLVMFLRNSVPCMDESGSFGDSCGGTPVVVRRVCLRCRRVCLL